MQAPEPVSIARLKAEREARMRDLVARLGLDVVVAVSGGARGQRGNVRYLSNYATTSQSSMVLWAREGAPRLIVPYSVHRCWAETTSWIPDIQVDADYARAISAYLRQQHAERAKIGWAGPPYLLEGVRASFDALSRPAESQWVQGPLTALRWVKTPEECKLMRRGGQIADAVLTKIRETVRLGVTERDLVAEAEYLARRLGCEGASELVSRGTLMAQPTPQENPLAPGDILQYSIEPEGPGGMWVQTVRMYALDEPPADWKRLIDAGVLAEQRGATLLKHGCPAHAVAQAMSSVLPHQVPLITPLGHGIGLDNSEAPRISVDSPDQLLAGMTIVLHPTEYGDQTALFLGNTYLLTADGAERLSTLPSNLVVV
jgi:Xaa-Pro aminopeptidase